MSELIRKVPIQYGRVKEHNSENLDYFENPNSENNLNLHSNNGSINVQGDNIEVNPDLLQEIGDAFTTLGNGLAEKQDKLVISNLSINGVRAQNFTVNYGNYSASKNSYVPICEIEAFNYGKAALCFEIIGREDSYGFSAKYYFSSRCWEDYDCDAGASLESNFSFLGSCYMNSAYGKQYFDKGDIVVVEAGHKTKNSKRGSKYIIYRKIKSAVWGDINNALITHSATATMSNFYIINVLYEDSQSYCIIKWYYTGQEIQSFSSRQAFPATGSSLYTYVATDTGLAYVWSNNEYILSSRKEDSFIGNTSYARLYSTVGRTTFTDYNSGTTKNIADYAVSATFTND